MRHTQINLAGEDGQRFVFDQAKARRVLVRFVVGDEQLFNIIHRLLAAVLPYKEDAGKFYNSDGGSVMFSIMDSDWDFIESVVEF